MHIQPRLLAVDIGNRHIKMGLFQPVHEDGLGRPIATLRLDSGCKEFHELQDWLPDSGLVWLVASVQSQSEHRLSAWVARQRVDDSYRLLRNVDLPIAVDIEQPESVGTDRLLAAVAVNRLRGERRPAIVVDAGSAITVDLLDGDGAFQGGVILPGFGMVARALADGTDRLPHVPETGGEVPPPVVGKSTVQAIRSGLFWGNVGAVREIVTRVGNQLGQQPELFVAGGDAQSLVERLQAQAQVVPDLVLCGIFETWRSSDPCFSAFAPT